MACFLVIAINYNCESFLSSNTWENEEVKRNRDQRCERDVSQRREREKERARERSDEVGDGEE